jgi:hypothetical protein
MGDNLKKKNKLGWLVLFTTSSTLICCALPILLVTLGMGAVVASVASFAPWLVWLTNNKIWVFIISGLLLAFATWSLYRPGRSCPMDPELGKYCTSAHKWNSIIIIVSAVIWFIGFFSAYILPLLIV